MSAGVLAAPEQCWSSAVLLLAWQGCFVLAGVSAGWVWAAGRRSASLASALAPPDPAPARERPHVTAVLPVKGCTPAKLRNWTSQTHSDYAGRLDVVFVVESAADAALCDTLQRLPSRRCSVVVAGLATGKSQKIHNQLAGVASGAPETRYFLFLDDDVSLYPSTVELLVSSLEADPQAFMATGYPFDVPHPQASCWSLCVMAYHLPLLVAFSHGQVSKNVWGGCMLLPAPHFAPDGCVTRAWGEGAYSDDLILASLAGSLRRRILCPGCAVFPIHLEPRCTAAQAWNYLRRQSYVLDTYMSGHNRRVNHALLACTAYAAWALLAPLFAVLSHAATLTLTTRGQGSAQCAGDTLAALSYCLLCCAACCAVRRMYAVLFAVSDALSPRWRSEFGHKGAAVPWARVMLALFVTQAMLLACSARLLCSRTVTWAGVAYTRSGGRVRVLHRAGAHPEPMR